MMAAAAETTAQSTELTRKSYISIGPVGSFGHSWTNNLGSRNNEFKAAPALGAGMLFSMHEHWAYGSQLLLSHEGYTRQIRMNGNWYQRTVNPIYLRMPMSVNYFFGSYGNAVRPKLYLGPVLGLKLSEHEDIDFRGADLAYRHVDEFRTFDLGLQGGAGVNIRLWRTTWLNLDAGYYQGLLDASDRPGETDYNTNANLRFNAGLFFGL